MRRGASFVFGFLFAVALVGPPAALAAAPAHYAGHPIRVMGVYASPTPVGLSPATIKSVYSFPTSLAAGAGKTIAIVDAYDPDRGERSRRL